MIEASVHRIVWNTQHVNCVHYHSASLLTKIVEFTTKILFTNKTARQPKITVQGKLCSVINKRDCSLQLIVDLMSIHWNECTGAKISLCLHHHAAVNSSSLVLVNTLPSANNMALVSRFIPCNSVLTIEPRPWNEPAGRTRSSASPLDSVHNISTVHCLSFPHSSFAC